MVILNLCLKKTWTGKSWDYNEFIVFKKHRFQNVFCPHENAKPAFSNSSGLKSVFEKFRFRDGLVWTVGLTVENKAALLNFSGVVNRALIKHRSAKEENVTMRNEGLKKAWVNK